MLRRIVLAIATVMVAAQVAGASADHKINQQNKAFSIKEIAVAAGDSITFMNADEVTHNVYSATPGLEFELRTQAPGKSDTVKFDKKGSLVVECAIHPKMKVQVTVK
jgi:plastocyanin